MSNIEPARLARLRPEKLDDNSVKKQILLIQKACGNVSTEKIALVFHECDYNMQQTISRIRAGDFDDGGWQTAKSNNKKKTQHTTDPKINGGTMSDSERSLSQRTSPTSSLRGGHYRNDYSYQYPPPGRTNSGRRGNHSGRNSRYPPRNKSIPSANSSQQVPDEPAKQSNEEISQRISPSIDEYEFIDGIPQSLSFDNSQLKTSLQTLSKRRTPSSIPLQPVSMHPSVKLPTEPIDIQFGDVQWNDSVPVAVSPSESLDIPSELNNHENEIPSNSDNQNQDVQDTLSTNYMNHQSTNEIDNPLHETTNQLSTLSIADNTISNSLTVVPADGTSHLSDHLTDTSSPMSSAQYSSQQQIPMNRLPPTSTPRAPDTSSTPPQYIVNNLQQTTNGITSSAFTPFNALVNYSSMPREYTQTTANWNPQTSNYKTTAKGTIIPTATYPPQPTYQLPNQQQQIFVGTYQYAPLSPGVVPVFTSLDQWQMSTYAPPIESYQYPAANYIPPYPNQQTYHLPPTKYDQLNYDKEYFAQYGQVRSLNNDISYQQQQQQQQQPQAQQQSSTLSQPIKETHLTSKLSPNAASFCQGAPLTVAPQTAATALYINPVGFSLPNYFPPVAGSINQERISSYSSLDNRDNRNGASYSSTTNRNNYYHHGPQQQQRTHNNNGSNSNWHSQQ